MNKKQSIGKIFLYTILVIYAIITLYPFIWTISATFKTLAEITDSSAGIIPENFTLDNYINLIMKNPEFVRWFMNSLIIALVGTFINVILNSMAGYSLARLNFAGRNTIYHALIAAMAIPAQVLIIPNFLVIKTLGLLNNYLSVILPASVSITYIFLMKQYYTNFSKDIEEAAKIDGLSGISTFFRMALPLARPVIATQATFIFLGFWNEFLRAMLYLKDVKLFTLPVGIQYTLRKYAGYTQWNDIMTASIVSLIPIVVIYIVLNKYFMQGMRMDAEK